ncbi:MAG: DUF4271 domain-containing protein [Bacteroidota bacterium]|nr:DUF4271 domain-containing protein [Bacteroidota bacterium]
MHLFFLGLRLLKVFAVFFSVLMLPSLLHGQSIFDPNYESGFPSYYLYVLAACMLLMVVARLLLPTSLRDMWVSLFSIRDVLVLFQEGRLGFRLSYLLLDVIFIICFSMLLQVFFRPGEGDIFLWLLGSVAIIYVLKLILIEVLAFTFFGQGEALVHILTFLTLTRWMGMILVPALFGSLFQTVFPVAEMLQYLVYALAVIYLLWLLRLLFRLHAYSLSRGLYVFLYLCTLEISPFLIVYKTFIR